MIKKQIEELHRENRHNNKSLSEDYDYFIDDILNVNNYYRKMSNSPILSPSPMKFSYNMEDEISDDVKKVYRRKRRKSFVLVKVEEKKCCNIKWC